MSRFHEMLLKGVLFLLIATGSSAQRPPAPAEWSAPANLPEMPGNQLHRWPVMTTVGDTLYLAANVYPIDGTAVGARPIYLTRIPGGPIPAPPGDFQFVYPRIVAGANGDIHLVWAEFDSARHELLRWDDGATSLWHAVRTGDRWSEPRKVYTAEWLHWPKQGAIVTVDKSGTVHVVAMAASGPTGGFMHLKGTTAHAWSATKTPHTLRSFPKAAIHASGDSLVIAYVGGSADSAAMMVATSTSAGATWSPGTVVHRLAHRFAWEPRLIRSGSTLYLTWTESPSGGSRDTLRVTRLDASLHAAAVTAVPLPRGTSTVAIAPECGGLVALAETFSTDPRTFEITVSETGAISQRPLRPEGELALFSAIGATSRAVVAVLAIRPEGMRGRAVQMSRPTQCRGH